MDFMKDGVDIRSAISSLKDGKIGTGGDAHFYDDNRDPSKIRQNLASSKEAEKLKGLKWLLANLSKGKDVSEFFPDVVKNVVVKSVEVKKMVYNYLVHYADFDMACRENSLLSINSFQNDLNGSNQLIRGLALRVMTSIRCPDIIQIQLLAVRKCASDSSPYVKRCAATALPKIFAYDPSQLDSLKQVLRKLLADTSTMVLGQALSSFTEICPTSYDTIHPYLRTICHLLADLDEWTQVSALNILIRYCRNQFLDPLPEDIDTKKVSITTNTYSKVEKKRRVVVKKAFYSDDEDESGDEQEIMTGAEKGSVFAEPDADHNLDPDHKLILRSSTPLLKSRNAGVVVAVCSLHFYCGSRGSQSNIQIGKALVRILRNQREIQYVVLSTISSMAQENPALFVSFLPDFFIKSADPNFNRLLKLDILASIATKQNIELILRELQVYVKHTNKTFVSAVIKAVGRVSDVNIELSGTCMQGLLYLLHVNRTPEVVDEILNTLRLILMQDTTSDTSILVLKSLIKQLLIEENAIEVSSARSNIIWLVGENMDRLVDVAPDILRLLAAGFPDEETETKTQIMNLAIKLSLKLPDDENVQSLSTYVLEMARYDVDTDLRDRSRFMTALMGLAPSNENSDGIIATVDEDSLSELAENASGILLTKKPAPTNVGPIKVEGMPSFTVGSLSSLVGHYVAGYECLLSWPGIQPNPSTRDALPSENDDRQFTDRVSKLSKGEKDTKPFYDEESDNSKSSSNDDSSDDSSNSTTSDSSNESDSEDSDDDSDTSSSSSSEIESHSDSASDESDDEVHTPLPLAVKHQQQKSLSSVKKVKKGEMLSVSSPPLSISVATTKASPFDLSLLDFTSPPVSTYVQAPSQDPYADMQLQMQPPPQQQGMIMQQQQPMLGMNAISGMDSPGSLGLLPMQQQQYPQQHHMLQQSGIQSMSNMQPMMSGMQPMMMNPVMQLQQQQQSMFVQQAMAIPHHTQQSQALISELLSHPVTLLQPELCGGLHVILFYRNGAKPVIYANAACVMIIVKNNGELPIRRFKLTIPSEIKKAPQLEDIPMLNKGQEYTYTIEMVLQGFEGKALQINATSDRGTFNSVFTPETSDLLTPLIVTPDEFVAIRSKLTSFHEVTRVFEISAILNSSSSDIVSELISRVKKVINTRHVVTTSTGEIYFASCLRKGMTEEKALVTLIIQGGQFTVKLNCDNPAFSNTLMEVFKKGLFR